MRFTRRRHQRALYPGLLQEFGDQAGPASLVIGADAGAVVAVEVFVEEDEVAPVGIILEKIEAAGDRTATIFAANEDVAKSLREVTGDLPKVHFAFGAG